MASGRFADALAAVDAALEATPGDAEALFARGSTLFDWGRVREALPWYLRARDAGCERRSLAAQLGWCCFRLGDLAAAEAWSRRAVAVEPDSTSGFYCLGLVLRAQKRCDEAVAILESGLARHPGDFHLLVLLSGCRLDQKLLPAAEDAARRATVSLPDHCAGWSALGAALERQARYDEALAVSEEAWWREVTNGEALDCFVGLAHVLLMLDRPAAATALYEEALPLRPSVVGHGNYAFPLLATGRFGEGWWHYEFRWLGDAQRPSRLRCARPAWDGQDLRGRTILLRVEQGIGDVFQFLRYAPLVKALGATVVLRIRAGLERIASCFPGIDRVVAGADEDVDFDFHVPLMSLPRVFGTELDSIPASVPYLTVEPDRASRWAARLSGARGVKVGLVWAGNPDHLNDRNRSIPLRALLPMLGKAGASYYSLQVGRGEEELAAMPHLEIEALGPELGDYADTAALLGALDLLVCVDTSVAHLAGALGKEVWVLLPTPADWRWLRDREDSPWYPTMRLFRQRAPGAWSEVVDRVAAALDQRIGAAGQARAASRPGAATPPPLPALAPAEYLWPPRGHRPGLSAVAETRAGIVQYLPDETDVGLALGCYGELLWPQMELLSRLLRPGMTILEAGAGCGAHALSLAPIVGPAGHLIVCESRPLWRRILGQNLAANGIVNATVLPRPLGRPATTGSGDPFAAGAADTVDGLRLEQLGLLKCGIGVDALDVLRGAGETLWRLRSWLFLAASTDDELERLADGAAAHGYRCWKMTSPWFDARNFNRREFDLFDGRSALALLAFPEEVDVDVELAGCREL